MIINYQILHGIAQKIHEHSMCLSQTSAENCDQYYDHFALAEVICAHLEDVLLGFKILVECNEELDIIEFVSSLNLTKEESYPVSEGVAEYPYFIIKPDNKDNEQISLSIDKLAQGPIILPKTLTIDFVVDPEEAAT